VDPEKGKFRSFLLASLKNFLSDEFDRDNRIKRGGQIEFVTLDFEGGEERDREVPAGVLTHPLNTFTLQRSAPSVR